MDVEAAREIQSDYRRHLDTLDLSQPETLRAEVAKHRWWHRIDLGGGIVTPAARGGGASGMIPELALPDLKGKSVLDIGAWDGGLSFHAEKMGADVTAFDMARPPTFELASRALGSRVRYVEGDITMLDPATLGQFDVVMCLGVIYHVPSPFGVIQTAAAMARELLVIETDTVRNTVRAPVATFVLRAEEARADRNKYRPNFWIPNAACCRAMIKACGFSRVEQVSGRAAPASRGEEMVRRAQAMLRIDTSGYAGRAVFHGWR